MDDLSSNSEIYIELIAFAHARNVSIHRLIEILVELNALDEKASDYLPFTAENIQYRQLVEYSSDMLSVHSLAGVYLYASPTCQPLMGFAPEELVGHSAYDFFHPDDLEPILQSHTSILEFPDTYIVAYRIRHKNGDYHWVETTSRTVRDDEQKPQYIVSTTRNISKRKQAEAALQNTLHEREELIQELDAYAHSVAHDLKTPLQIVLGYANLLQDEFQGFSDEEKVSYLKLIEQTARKMAAITEALLLLASTRRSDEIPMKPLDTSHILQEVQERFQKSFQEMAAVLVVPDCFPIALGYAPWVEEIWVNYISNALKYGGRPPRLELGADEHADTIRFWVRDNGDGLTPEQQAALFVPFKRLRIGEAYLKGDGVGLSIVKRIVERLGGEVGVESGVGQGSTFSFTLPKG